MKIILIIIIITLHTYGQSRITGRVVDIDGRGIYRVSVKAQANLCAPDFQYTPVYDQYGSTNIFGWYNLSVPADCLSYSIIINPPYGYRQREARNFYPAGYYIYSERLAPQTFRGNDFYEK